jgi:hypothetical protein
MSTNNTSPRKLPALVYPVLCFTQDGDVWAVRDEFDLTTCGPETLAKGIQIGMDVVDAAGSRWRVASVRHVGYPPLSRRSFRLFQPPLRSIEHELEPMPALSLREVQERVCSSFDAFPEYWCELADKDVVLPELKAEVRATRSIAEIHDRLGVDCFVY